MSIPLPPTIATQPDDNNTKLTLNASLSNDSVIPPKPDTKLTLNETKFILDKCLLAIHRDDPTVLRFIEAYMHTRSVPQAAREANLISRHGHILRKRPDIHEAISQLTDKALNKYGYDASEIIERVKEIANVDPIMFENPDGSYKKSMHEIPFEARTAIKKFRARNTIEKDANGIEVVTGQIIEVEFWDKMKGLDLLGKEKDIFKDTLDVNSNIKISIVGALAEADARLLAARDVTDE